MPSRVKGDAKKDATSIMKLSREYPVAEVVDPVFQSLMA